MKKSYRFSTDVQGIRAIQSHYVYFETNFVLWTGTACFERRRGRVVNNRDEMWAAKKREHEENRLLFHSKLPALKIPKPLGIPTWVRKIMNIPGVEKVDLDRYELSVKHGGLFDTNNLHDKIMKVVGAEFGNITRAPHKAPEPIFPESLSLAIQHAVQSWRDKQGKPAPLMVMRAKKRK